MGRPQPQRLACTASIALVLTLLAAAGGPALAKPCSVFRGGRLAEPPGSSVRDTGLGYKTVRRAGKGTRLPMVGDGQPCGHALGVCGSVRERLAALSGGVNCNQVTKMTCIASAYRYSCRMLIS